MYWDTDSCLPLTLYPPVTPLNDLMINAVESQDYYKYRPSILHSTLQPGACSGERLARQVMICEIYSNESFQAMIIIIIWILRQWVMRCCVDIWQLYDWPQSKKCEEFVRNSPAYMTNDPRPKIKYYRHDLCLCFGLGNSRKCIVLHTDMKVIDALPKRNTGWEEWIRLDHWYQGWHHRTCRQRDRETGI